MECPNQIEDEECLCSDMEVGNQDKRLGSVDLLGLFLYNNEYTNSNSSRVVVVRMPNSVQFQSLLYQRPAFIFKKDF